MKQRFAYHELYKNEPIIITRKRILEKYTKHVRKMAAKLGKPEPTEEEVIEEFCVNFCAWEIGPEDA